MSDLIIAHLMDLKSSVAEQKALMESVREDLTTHAATHKDLTARIERLEIWPQTGAVVIKILVTVASLVSAGYGVVKVLPSPLTQSRQVK